MTALDKSSALTITSAKASLRQHAKRIDYYPQTNSVFAFAGELFQRLENGTTDIDALGAIVQDVYGALIEQRATRFRDQHQLDAGNAWAETRQCLEAIAKQGWAPFRAAVETPSGGVVFTAHPTFALSKTARDNLADLITAPSAKTRKTLKQSLTEDGRVWAKTISLHGEHAEAQTAIANAQHALTAYADLIYDVAEAAFPKQWQSLRPQLPTVASWIGYDLDGRTDIHWS